jgi:hypothetical protein
VILRPDDFLSQVDTHFSAVVGWAGIEVQRGVADDAITDHRHERENSIVIQFIDPFTDQLWIINPVANVAQIIRRDWGE